MHSDPSGHQRPTRVVYWRAETVEVCSLDHPPEDHMRPNLLHLAAITLAACATGDRTADTAGATAAAATPATPAPLNLADVAGVWTVRGTNMAGDTTLVTYELNATADTSGWTITFPGRPPVPVRVVAVAGDSVITEAGPYQSSLRRGVNVRTTGAFRIQDGRLIGHTVARYDTRDADSVLMVRSEGTRKP
jgi:hypothetical protein